jgi:hypothetical protein
VTHLLVSPYLAAQRFRHPVACIVRKYGDAGTTPKLRRCNEALLTSIKDVACNRCISIFAVSGDSVCGSLWLDVRDAIASSWVSCGGNPSPSATLEISSVPVAYDCSTQSGLVSRKLPPLSSETTTAIVVVVGAASDSSRDTRGYALEVVRAFKRTCASAYCQFIPTIVATPTA